MTEEAAPQAGPPITLPLGLLGPHWEPLESLPRLSPESDVEEQGLMDGSDLQLPMKAFHSTPEEAPSAPRRS